ncbi:aminopeptidase P family protein, partial [Thermococci archaeon]
MNRLDKLVGLMDDYMGALITPGTNFYYLTGLNPSATGERLFLLAL